MYLHSSAAHQHASFEEMASFQPFGQGGGVSVATTSTTDGADLLVSALSSGGGEASVLRFRLDRNNKAATALSATLLGAISTDKAAQPLLAGD